jgi:NitT/TauT family transport system permease protein
MQRFGSRLTGALGIALALAIWQGLVDGGLLSPFAAPPPSTIVASVPSLIVEEGVLAACLQTFGETFAAVALAAVAGIPLGWWLHHSRRAALAYESWVAAIAAAPLVLLYPLFLVMFGRSAGTIVAMGTVAALPPIALKTKEGLDGTRRALLDVGRSLRLTPRQQFIKIMLPAAAPVIGNGLRLGLIFALINVVGIEFLINFGGLGALIATLGERFELPTMFAAIGCVVLISVGFFVLTERLERWLRRG